MLVYNPIYDTNHCILRLLCILKDIYIKDIEINHLKLLDFYVLFPSLLKKIRFSSNLRSKRQIATNVPEPYEDISNPKRLFFNLGHIQDLSLRSLISIKFINREDFIRDRIALNTETLSSEILNLIEEQGFRNEEWYQIIIEDLSEMNLYGRDGLKSRSGLMEYRHDSL